jgi:predicted protein tyrosine phosphatase
MSKVTRNRLGNSKNHYQGDFKKVLCVCSAGLLRSPTAAWVLSNAPFNFNTRAVGSNPDYAMLLLDAVNVCWADEVVVMDSSQANLVKELLNEYGWDKPVHVLNTPDDYGYRDPELVELMTEKLLEVFPVSE